MPRPTPSTRPRQSPARRPPRAGAHARAAAAFARLVDVMAVLRSPRGCPWDRKQTHASLRPYLIEECYEALDAIDRGDPAGLRGELGDVLFQCVFHAQLAAEAKRFTIADVLDAVTAKLIGRHPHVFDAAGRPLGARARRRRELGSSGAVVEQWARLKARERAAAGDQTGVLAGLPRALPALLRAHKIGGRVAAVGFDWPEAEAVVDKIEEEVRELRAALAEGRARTTDEMGDLLFSIANLARKLHVDPEMALSQANDKFTRRFEAVERHLATRGLDVHAASLEQLEAAWAAVKRAAARRARPSSPRSSSAGGRRARRSRR